jgi:hypothetical protein
MAAYVVAFLEDTIGDPSVSFRTAPEHEKRSFRLGRAQ